MYTTDVLNSRIQKVVKFSIQDLVLAPLQLVISSEVTSFKEKNEVFQADAHFSVDVVAFSLSLYQVYVCCPRLGQVFLSLTPFSNVFPFFLFFRVQHLVFYVNFD